MTHASCVAVRATAALTVLTALSFSSSAQTVTVLPNSSTGLYNNSASQVWSWLPPSSGYCGVFFCPGQDNTYAWIPVNLNTIEPDSLSVAADSSGVAVRLKSSAAQPLGAEAPYLAAQVKVPLNASLQSYKQYRVSVTLNVANTSNMGLRLGLSRRNAVVPDITAATFKLNTGTQCTIPSTGSTLRTCTFNAVYVNTDAANGNAMLWLAPTTYGFDAKVTDIKVQAINSDPLRHHRTGWSPATSIGAKFTPASFGFTMNAWNSASTDWPSSLNAGLLRIWDNGAYWARLQPTPGPFDPLAMQRLERFVRNASERTPKAEVVLTLGISPPWAVTNCQPLAQYNEPDSPACSTPPRTAAEREAWKSYVRTLATKFKGQVRYFELWNEPDIMFSGTHQELVDLAADARSVLESVQPSHFKLIAPSTTSNGTELLDGFLAKGGGQYVDIIGVHSYYSATEAEKKISADIANVYFRLAHHGQANKPIWNTEGAPRCDENPQIACGSSDLAPSVAAQRSLHIRAMAALLANGATNFSYYHMEGAAGAGTALRAWLALSRKDAGAPQTLTPNGEGFARSVAWLNNLGATDAWNQPGTPIHVMRLGSSTTTLSGVLLWNTSGVAQTVQIPAGSWSLWRKTTLINRPSGTVTYADGTTQDLSKLSHNKSNQTVLINMPAHSAARVR